MQSVSNGHEHAVSKPNSMPARRYSESSGLRITNFMDGVQIDGQR